MTEAQMKTWTNERSRIRREIRYPVGKYLECLHAANTRPRRGPMTHLTPTPVTCNTTRRCQRSEYLLDWSQTTNYTILEVETAAESLGIRGAERDPRCQTRLCRVPHVRSRALWAWLMTICNNTGRIQCCVCEAAASRMAPKGRHVSGLLELPAA